MLGNTFDRVLTAIRKWQPKKSYRSEAGYRDDLLESLRGELNGANFFGFQEKHRIRKEHGRHLADIGIDEKIGIELKRDLRSQSNLDRLIGQVRRFLRSYSLVIVVLCGDSDKELLDDLRVEFKRYSGNIVWSGPIVEIVEKVRDLHTQTSGHLLF